MHFGLPQEMVENGKAFQGLGELPLSIYCSINVVSDVIFLKPTRGQQNIKNCSFS